MSLTGNNNCRQSDNRALFGESDAANEMNTADETSFGYDKNGNTIRMLKPSENEPYEYSYDYAQRLEKVTFPDGREAEYNHNADGHRMYKIVSGEGATIYYWDPGVISGISQVLNEVDVDDNPIADYFYGRGIVPLGIKVNGEYRYYLTDIQGSILALTDDDGVITDRYEYDEYGTQTRVFGNFPNSLGYTGQYYDEETGCIYLRNRYYDPELGRFISRDPIGIAGGLNLYGYVKNTPIRNIDPLGLNGSESAGNTAIEVYASVEHFVGLLVAASAMIGVGAIVTVTSITAGVASLTFAAPSAAITIPVTIFSASGGVALVIAGVVLAYREIPLSVRDLADVLRNIIRCSR